MVRGLPRWIAGVLAGVVIGGSAWAQPSAPLSPSAERASPLVEHDLRWTLGSSTAGLPGDADEPATQYEVDPAHGLELREIAEEDVDVARLGGASRAALDGFDGLRHAVASVEAFFERRLGPEEERGGIWSTATLCLLLRTRAADGRTRWWRLAGGSEGLTERLAIREEPVDASTATELDELERDQLAAATSDPRLPIVDVQYSSTMLGARSASTTRHHLLIDFRAAIPRVIGFFDELERGCGGACNVYSCIFGVAEEIGCRWDAGLDDFLCASTLRRRDTAWMERRATRYFRFTSGTPVATPTSTWRGGLDPSIPRDVLPALEASRHVDGYGVVSTVARTMVGTRGVSLVGAPALSWDFGARFFAALDEGTERGPLIEIGSRLDVRRLHDGTGGSGMNTVEAFQRARADFPPTYTPDGPPPRFVATELVRAATWTVLQVLVVEGRGKGVYLVGLEVNGGQLVADAMLVATDGESHLECNEWRIPATAVRMTVARAPFRVQLDVEPPRARRDGPTADGEGDMGERAAPACRLRSTVTWEPGQGFAPVSRDERCGPARPRRVAIDDAGRITVAPASTSPPL